MLQRLICALAIIACCVIAAPTQSSQDSTNETRAKIQVTPEEEHNFTQCLHNHPIHTQHQHPDTADLQKATKIMVECLSEVKAFRSFVMVLNVASYYINDTDARNQVCGIPENSTQAKPIFDKIKKLSENMDETEDFCKLATEQLLPNLCKLKSMCTKNQQEVDFLFAAYYGARQLIDHHPEQYSCKDSNGKEVLGSIINPAAYTDKFDIFRDKILTKPLPCNIGKSQGQGSQNQGQSSQGQSSQNQDSQGRGSQNQDSQGRGSQNQGSQGQGSQSPQRNSETSSAIKPEVDRVISQVFRF